jgi:4a-hydroxytetrahydrobiopterin dehydratase
VADLLDADVLAEELGRLDGWTGDGSAIRRSAELPSFAAAIEVVDRVAQVAEESDHHPDIDIRWRTLSFLCSTHSAGGVTSKDVALAARIDEIVRSAGG